MDIKCYLAMTASELSAAHSLPAQVAYMACHYSSSSGGLSNLPTGLPPGSMVMLNDLTPPQGHDPLLIATQLSQLAQEQSVSCFLLDLQRPDIPENQEVASILTRTLPCPVGVTPAYAGSLECPVLLPPPPLHTPLKEHLQPWAGREIWLEAAQETARIKITAEGSEYSPLPDEDLTEPSFTEAVLHCQYCIQIQEDHALFTLRRDRQALLWLLQEAQSLGVCCAVGLYQQLKIFP